MLKYVLPAMLCLAGLWIAPAWTLIVLSTFLTLFILSRDPDPSSRNFLSTLFLAGLTIRLLIVCAMQFYLVKRGFCPGVIESLPDGFEGALFFDEHNFVQAARNIAWGFSNFNDYYFKNAHIAVLSWLYKNIGYDPMLGKLINCLASCFTALIIYRCGRIVFHDHRIAKCAAIITMLYPSLLFWSLTNLRDPLIVFFVTLFLYVILALFDKHMLLSIGIALPIALCIQLLRSGYFFVCLIFILLLIAHKLGHANIRLTRFVIACLFAGVCIVAFAHPVQTIYKKTLRQIAQRQHGNANANESEGNFSLFPDTKFQFRSTEEITTYDLMRAYYKGTLYFYTAPVPWKNSNNNFLNTLAKKESILWYVFLIFIAWGILRGIPGNIQALRVLLFLFINVSFLVLLEGNIGTLFRHRGILLPIFFLFLAQGLSLIMKVRETRVRDLRHT